MLHCFGDSYIEALQQELCLEEQQHAKTGARLLESSGNTPLLHEQPMDALHNSSVMLSIGGNDLIDGASSEEIAQNLKKTIQTLASRENDVYLLGMLQGNIPPLKTIETSLFNVHQEMNRFCENRDNRCKIIDFDTSWDVKNDGLHLTSSKNAYLIQLKK